MKCYCVATQVLLMSKWGRRMRSLRSGSSSDSSSDSSRSDTDSTTSSATATTTNNYDSRYQRQNVVSNLLCDESVDTVATPLMRQFSLIESVLVTEKMGSSKIDRQCGSIRKLSQLAKQNSIARFDSAVFAAATPIMRTTDLSFTPVYMARNDSSSTSTTSATSPALSRSASLDDCSSAATMEEAQDCTSNEDGKSNGRRFEANNAASANTKPAGNAIPSAGRSKLEIITPSPVQKLSQLARSLSSINRSCEANQSINRSFDVNHSYLSNTNSTVHDTIRSIPRPQLNSQLHHHGIMGSLHNTSMFDRISNGLHGTRVNATNSLTALTAHLRSFRAMSTSPSPSLPDFTNNVSDDDNNNNGAVAEAASTDLDRPACIGEWGSFVGFLRQVVDNLEAKKRQLSRADWTDVDAIEAVQKQINMHERTIAATRGAITSFEKTIVGV
jgi:hypothetical protein